MRLEQLTKGAHGEGLGGLPVVRGWILESLGNMPGENRSGGSQWGLTEVWTTTAEVSPQVPLLL